MTQVHFVRRAFTWHYTLIELNASKNEKNTIGVSYAPVRKLGMLQDFKIFRTSPDLVITTKMSSTSASSGDTVSVSVYHCKEYSTRK